MSKPNFPFRRSTALLAALCLVSPLTVGEPSRHAATQSASTEEAQELLKKGDEAYTAGRYADATEAYAGSRELIKESPSTSELRAAITERYAQAAVEHARQLSRKGDVPAAKALMDKILSDPIAPKNPGALALRTQLDDPIRTNPALTPEHGKNVDAVRRSLYTAQGAFDLGKFDEATTHYQAVLRLDPTNTAARRGMERVASAKSDYQKSAFDHTRAEMLSEVDRQWELNVPPAQLDLALGDPNSGLAGSQPISITNKLEQIILPKISLEQATLEEAISFLRTKAVEFDTLETDPTKKGLNLNINLGPDSSPAATKTTSARIDLQLTQVPLSEALKYITQATYSTYATDDFGVTVSPLGVASVDLVVRTYKVPPDFLTSIGSATNTTPTSPVGLFDKPAQETLTPQRLGAQDALTQQGVTFPEGASATFVASNSTLRVTNTQTNQDLVSQIVSTLNQTEPVMVTVNVTMIKVEQSHLEELGFDWLLDNAHLDNSNKRILSGGTRGNGGNLGDIPLADFSDIRNPVTAGNRSGDEAISPNSIDSVIGSQDRSKLPLRAPGVFGVIGSFSNRTNLQTLMRGLDQKKGVDYMAQPSVVTRSGQASSVAVVREFMYATEYEPPELPQDTGGDRRRGTTTFSVIVTDASGNIIGGGSFSDRDGNSKAVTPATPTAFKKKDVGITLEVLPVVDPSKQFVNITLTPTVSDFDGFVNYGSPINTTASTPLGEVPFESTPNRILMPVFSKQTLTTSVDVADGGTVVVGGLLQDRVQNVEDKTPILGDIPWVGRLFQSKVSKPTSTAIIFLVNTKITDPTGQSYNNR